MEQDSKHLKEQMIELSKKNLEQGAQLTALSAERDKILKANQVLETKVVSIDHQLKDINSSTKGMIDTKT